MATPSTIVIRSLQILGEMAIGDTLVSAQEVAYLSVLNNMVDSWSIDDLMIYQTIQESFALTTAAVSYTIGPAGTVSTIRPLEIKYAFIRDAANLDSELRLLDQPSYNRIVLKSSGNTYPQYLYYDNLLSVSGLSTLNLYPAPSAGLSCFIDSTKVLQSFPLITTSVNLPPGYLRALEFNLACDIAPGFVPIPPDVLRIAKESKAALKSANLPAPVLRLDAAIVGNRQQGTSILTGP